MIKTIKSSTFALCVAILSVLLQSFHSYTAFYNMSSLKGSIWGISQAILFAIVIDLAILFYTVRNKTTIALWAAVMMFIINAYYYFQYWGFAPQLYFGCFLAAIIPASVYFYSEEIKEEITPTQMDEIRRIAKSDFESSFKKTWKETLAPGGMKHGIPVLSNAEAMEQLRSQGKTVTIVKPEDHPAEQALDLGAEIDASLLGVTEDKPKPHGEYNPMRSGASD